MYLQTCAGAGRPPLCVRGHSKYENLVMGRSVSHRVVREAMEARRMIKDLQDEATNLAERGRIRRWWEVPGEIGSLLSVHLLAE